MDSKEKREKWRKLHNNEERPPRDGEGAGNPAIGWNLVTASTMCFRPGYSPITFTLQDRDKFRRRESERGEEGVTDRQTDRQRQRGR